MSNFDENSERLAKFIARAGRASRRDAEKLIEAGRVEVNGKRVDTPVFKVGAGDEVRVDGEALKPPPLRVWLYHKPAGLVTTARDEKGRRTIFDELPKALQNVNTIGRLDLNSEGLLILTNHGGLKRVLELPSTGWRRKYRVRAYGKVGEAALERLREGITVEGERFLPMEVVMEREQGDNAWYIVALREGKNREIRRAFEEIGLQVNRLIRVSYGPFQLGSLDKGGLSEVRPKALRTLLGGHLPEDAELATAPMDLSEEEADALKPRKGQSTKALNAKRSKGSRIGANERASRKPATNSHVLKKPSRVGRKDARSEAVPRAGHGSKSSAPTRGGRSRPANARPNKRSSR